MTSPSLSFDPPPEPDIIEVVVKRILARSLRDRARIGKTTLPVMCGGDDCNHVGPAWIHRIFDTEDPPSMDLECAGCGRRFLEPKSMAMLL